MKICAIMNLQLHVAAGAAAESTNNLNGQLSERCQAVMSVDTGMRKPGGLAYHFQSSQT